jgi:hypothetical protein
MTGSVSTVRANPAIRKRGTTYLRRPKKASGVSAAHQQAGNPTGIGQLRDREARAMMGIGNNGSQSCNLRDTAPL